MGDGGCYEHRETAWYALRIQKRLFSNGFITFVLPYQCFSFMFQWNNNNLLPRELLKRFPSVNAPLQSIDFINFQWVSSFWEGLLWTLGNRLRCSDDTKTLIFYRFHSSFTPIQLLFIHFLWNKNNLLARELLGVLWTPGNRLSCSADTRSDR